MSKRHFLFGLVLLMGMTALVWAFSSEPPDHRAGNPPGNQNCTACHSSFTVNSGDGSFFIDNVPSEYTPDETYTITVTLSDPGQSRWGFELTVLYGNNDQAGTDNGNRTSS